MARVEGSVAPSGDRNGVIKALSIGGLLAALGASSCCVVPFLLFSFGVSGAWIADITALAPYQPIFVGVALACLGGGFALIRREARAAACNDEARCARPASDRALRIGLWAAAMLVVAAVAVPRVAPLFLSN